MDTFEALNDAIVKRNMSARNAKRFPRARLANENTWQGRSDYWESTAAKHAAKLGTRLVPLPGTTEDIITAELFLRLAGAETE